MTGDSASPYRTSAAAKIADLFQSSLALRKRHESTSVTVRLPKLVDTNMKLVDSGLLHSDKIYRTRPPHRSVRPHLPSLPSASQGGRGSTLPPLPALSLTELEKLERFDDSEAFESHTPDEWLAEYAEDQDQHAFVYHFANGAWTFVPCWVRGYDAEEARYEVELFDGSKKAVKRLRLRFKVESVDSFSARLESAQRLKGLADLEREFVNLVLTDGRFGGFHRVVKAGDCDEVKTQKIWADRLGVALKVLTVEEQARFESVLIKYRKSEALPTVCIPLTLSANRVRDRARQHESSAVFERSFRLACDQWFLMLSNEQFFWLDTNRGAMGKYAKVLLRVGGEKMLNERIRRERDGKLLDCDECLSPDHFIEKLKRHRDMVTYALDSEWRGSVLSGIMEQVKFDFFTNKLAVYVGHPINRLIKKVGLMMNVKVRELLETSLVDFSRFMLTFVSANPPRDSALLLKLTSSSGVITLEPSIEEVTDQFAEMIESVLKSAASLPGIEKQLLPCLPEIGQEPLIADEDLATLRSAVKETIEVTNHVLRTCLVEPLQLKVRYSRFSALNSEFHVEDDITTDLAKVEKMIKEILTLDHELSIESASFVDFPLYRVDTESLKRQLLERSRESLNHISNLLVEFVLAELSNLEAEWLAIIDHIASIPKDEKSLADLKDFLSSLQSGSVSSNPQTALLARQAHAQECVRLLLAILRDSRGLELEIKLLEYLHWPATVGVAVMKRFRRIEAEKIKFTSRLTEEKAKLLSDIEAWKSELSVIIECFTDYAKATEYAVKVHGLYEKLQEGIRRVEDFNRRENVFAVELSSKAAIEAMLESYDPYYRMWVLVSDWRYAEEEWTAGSLVKLKADEVRSNVENWGRALYKMQKFWAGKLAESANAAKQNAIVSLAIDGICAFKEKLLPIIESVCHDSFVMRHWVELFDAVEAEELVHQQTTTSGRSQTTITPNANDIDVTELTLTGLLELGISKHLPKVEEIAGSARKEWSLRRGLQNMKTEWKGVMFDLLVYKQTGTSLIRGTDEIQVLLDDHIVKTQAIRGSPHSKSFEKEAKEWEARLLYIQEALDVVLSCQKTWLYLEPIFGSEDIVRQMPGEARKFGSVDQLWRNTMSLLKENPSLLDFSDIENVLFSFQEAVKRLDEIGKSLNDYLETKRMAFPRFYFLSNDELLSILSETKDPERVQPHLSKCFEGVHRVLFAHDAARGSSHIQALISSEGERVDLLNGGLDVNAGENKGAVEKWLCKLEKLMFDSLISTTQNSIKAYAVEGDINRDKWVLEWPGQVVLAVDNIFYSRDVASAIEANGLPQYLEKLNRQLDGIVKLVRGDLNSLGRRTLGALTTIDVHNRDVVAQLITEKVTDPEGFEWLSQMRYYWTAECAPVAHPLTVAMVNSKLAYNFEYLGNSDRLVITPLTDRCYRTLMGAYHLFYGAAPEGPAGTGKTESVKSLAMAVAVQCVIFNCSDGVDAASMGKFFKGLASSGAWICFDEFNRCVPEVLSVIAQQVLTIQLAIRERRKEFVFEGVQIKLVPSCAVNITMNPGYAGRAELPDNLKVLFRPCAMMVPDYNLIAEIYLYGSGMENSRAIGRKAVQALKLSSEQLSSQDHYDFGMRGLKSLLVAAGQLKRKLGDSISEFAIALKAFLDVNIPKFTANDIPLFKGIVADLFPGVELPEVNNTEFIETVEIVTNRLGHVCTPNHLLKVTQLWETLLVRHGLMTVGAAPCGKSVVLNTLAVSMDSLSSAAKVRGVVDSDYKEIVKYIINPKSIKSTELYGSFDDATHEWSDGVIAIAVRNASKADQDGRRHWIVLDGPVDAVWVENMNSVLDDNKKLCLLSGEIIKLSPLTNMMFEVADLSVASPATVSRCGMVFMEPGNLGWRVIVQSYLNNEILRAEPTPVTEDFASDAAQKKMSVKVFDMTMQLFDTHFETLWILVRRECRNIIAVSENWLALSSARMFVAMARKFGIAAKQATEEEIKHVFVFALLWSVGGCVDEQGRAKLDPHFRQMLEPTFLGESVYDMFLSKSFEWKPWVTLIEKSEIPRGVAFHQIIVPTKDTVRNQFLLDMCISSGLHVLLAGGTGRGKTVCISQFLKELSKDSWTSLSFAFSAQTSASQTQDIVDGKLDKRRKGVYGPPVNKHMVIFVDDLNMPQKEVYGAQPPIELLRQCLSQGGWYDRKTSCDFRRIVDVNFIAAVGGNKPDSITSRYLWYYNAVGVVDYAEDSLSRIFEKTVGHFYQTEADLIERVVRGAIDVYGTVVKELLPTPSKSHYLFNLRDLSKVFQGITLPRATAKADSQIDIESLVSLWRHELERVFGDRLVSAEDRAWFAGVLESRISRLFPGANTYESVLFTDIVSGRYERVLDVNKLLDKAREALTEYNRQSKYVMSLVLFLNFIEHVTRVVRVLRLPLGNMLSVGVGGSGRKSVTYLASHMVGYDLFSIEVTKSYGKKEWQEDLKRVLVKAGAQGQLTTFILSDTQLSKEAFFEDINNLLNTGEAPNLFNAEEKNAIVDMCAKTAKQDTNASTPQEVFAWFVAVCRKNLHVVLCMSPIGEGFRRRLRNYPSIVNCCTIDWYLEWPRDALVAVANEFLNGLFSSESQLHSITRVCAAMQEEATRLTQEYRIKDGRFFYVTPRSYLDLVRSFKELLISKTQKVQTSKLRYDGGIEKLNATAQQVAGMQKDLEDLQPVLKRTAQENAEMMQVITVKKKEAEIVKANVAVEEQEANKAAQTAMSIKEDCERDLSLALPALEAAMDALTQLSKADITEVKAMTNPPSGVVLVAEALCIMFSMSPKKEKSADGKGKVDNYWEPAKKSLFGDSKLITRLLEYDKDKIAPEIIKKITPFEADPNFDPEIVRKASLAAYGICKWVRAMIVYDRVAREVQPKRVALEAAESAFAEANKKLQAKKQELGDVEERVAELESQLKASVQKQEELKRQVEDCKLKLARAHKLIGGLGGERTRWTQSSRILGETMVNITGDVLIASGNVAYLGAFPGKYRTVAVRSWTEALQRENLSCASGTYSLADVVGDQVKIRQWVIDKLPNDSVSIDNAIIMHNSTRWPLMIDPQLQANRWIKTSYAGKSGPASNLKVLRLSQADYSRILETAIQLGFPVLIENVLESMDPMLEPLLSKSISKAGSLNMIKLGDTTIEYSDDFRLYLTTKLPNPHYSPEICVTVTILNFSATYEGLSDQLLSLVVAAEEPDKEKRRQDLVIESASSRAQLKELEDKILELLSNSKGNILDDEELIDTLSSSKLASQRIEERVVVQERTAKEIQETRLWYSPVAERSAKLFFVVSDLAAVEATYQYSLQWFVGIYLSSIATAERARGDQRLKNLNAEFMKRLYSNVCRSLFEKHKLLFSFLMSVRMLEFDKELGSDVLRVLLTGASGAVASELPPKPEASWVTEAMWAKIHVVSKLKGTLNGLSDRFVENLSDWKNFFDAEDPVKTKHPLNLLSGQPLTSLESALVLLCVRPDGLIRAIQEIVASKVGAEYLEPPPFNLDVYFQDSRPGIPLIFVLTSGADPMTEILKLADKQRMREKIRLISLGQGQGPKANRMISECSQIGGWVVLQNCHLATTYMPVLEGLLENFGADLHPEFRLWLTTMPSAEFPVSVLQNGIKMTVEPPKGLKQNLLRAYLSLDEQWLESSSKPSVFKGLLFSICLFHSVVLERRKFGPLGWNILYQFSDADRQISASQLHIFLEEFKQVPYEALNYMVAEANYGGRVTDAHDRRTIVAILKDYLNCNVESGYVVSGVYKIPDTTDRTGYLNFIKSLPLNESTEVFGLHQNADLTASISEGYGLISTALSVLGGGSGGTGVDLEQASLLAEAILGQLPPNDFDIEIIGAKFQPKYDESMNTVLVQELLRFNKLTRLIRSSLIELQKAVKGLVVMTPELQAVGIALVESRVPDVWKAASYPSLKPLLSYVADLNKRLQFLGSWVENGQAPISFWISGFFFTQGFLTGTLQNFSRRFKHPIDACMWNFQVMPKTWKPEEAALKGAYVHGMFIQGARWDDGRSVIAEAEPKVLFEAMPYVWLKPVELSDDETPSAHYACPLYKTSERRGVLSTTGHSTNFVMMVNLPIDAKTSTSRLWVKRGVAMLTQLDN